MAKKHHTTHQRHERHEVEDEDEEENMQQQTAASKETPTPAVGPSAPVGPVKTGPVGVDSGGNVWYYPTSGAAAVYVGTIAAGSIPASE
jgi:hypothetical protein